MFPDDRERVWVSITVPRFLVDRLSKGEMGVLMSWNGISSSASICYEELSPQSDPYFGKTKGHMRYWQRVPVEYLPKPPAHALDMEKEDGYVSRS